MSRALEAANAHMRAIDELRATAEEGGALDNTAFQQILFHQREWQQEMERFRVASNALTEAKPVDKQ